MVIFSRCCMCFIKCRLLNWRAQSLGQGQYPQLKRKINHNLHLVITRCKLWFIFLFSCGYCPWSRLDGYLVRSYKITAKMRLACKILYGELLFCKIMSESCKILRDNHSELSRGVNNHRSSVVELACDPGSFFEFPNAPGKWAWNRGVVSSLLSCAKS